MATKSKQKVTLIDPPTEPHVEIPRVHPGDNAAIDRAAFPLKELVGEEKVQAFAMDIARATGLPREAILELPKEVPDTPIPPAEKPLYSPFTRAEIEIRERYGEINGNVTGLLRGILTELVIRRLCR